MPWAVSPWVYPVWDSLDFLDLGGYFLPHFMEVFKDFLMSFFFFFLATLLLLFFNLRIIALQNFVFSVRHQQESATGTPIRPPSWTSLPSPSPSHPSRLSQSPCLSSHESYSKFPLASYFTYGIYFKFPCYSVHAGRFFTVWATSKVPIDRIDGASALVESWRDGREEYIITSNPEDTSYFSLRTDLLYGQ